MQIFIPFASFVYKALRHYNIYMNTFYLFCFCVCIWRMAISHG